MLRTVIEKASQTGVKNRNWDAFSVDNIGIGLLTQSKACSSLRPEQYRYKFYRCSV